MKAYTWLVKITVKNDLDQYEHDYIALVKSPAEMDITTIYKTVLHDIDLVYNHETVIGYSISRDIPIYNLKG